MSPGLAKNAPRNRPLKSGAETIPRSSLSPGNLGRFRQKPTAVLSLPGSMMKNGGEAGIRTRGTGFYPYNALAMRRFRPLSHLSAVSLRICES